MASASYAQLIARTSSLLNDHDRSLLVGGINSVTLSAREAEARPDKLRQVSRR